MKKLILILIIFTFFSCERDDICIQPTTPNLIVVFYNNTNQTERKEVSNLTIQVDSLGTFIPVNPIALDSITIPLRIDTDFTNIRLTTQQGALAEQNLEFTLNYLTEAVFVSRSCGFKTNFSEVTHDITINDWITEFTINQQNINDQSTKHISIFH